MRALVKQREAETQNYIQELSGEVNQLRMRLDAERSGRLAAEQQAGRVGREELMMRDEEIHKVRSQLESALSEIRRLQHEVQGAFAADSEFETLHEKLRVERASRIKAEEEMRLAQERGGGDGGHLRLVLKQLEAEGFHGLASEASVEVCVERLAQALRKERAGHARTDEELRRVSRSASLSRSEVVGKGEAFEEVVEKLRVERAQRLSLEMELERSVGENGRSQLGLRGEFEKTLTALRSQLEAAHDDLRQETMRRERAEAMAEEAISEVGANRKTAMAMERELRLVATETEDVRKAMGKQAGSLETRLLDAERQMASDKEALARLVRHNAQLEGDAEGLRAQCGELRLRLDMAERKMAYASEDRGKMLGDLKSEASKADKLGADMVDMHQRNGLLSTQLHDAGIKLEKANAVMEALREEVRSTRFELDITRRTADELRIDNQDLKARLGLASSSLAEEKRRAQHELVATAERLHGVSRDNEVLLHNQIEKDTELFALRTAIGTHRSLRSLSDVPQLDAAHLRLAPPDLPMLPRTAHTSLRGSLTAPPLTGLLGTTPLVGTPLLTTPLITPR